MLLAAILAKLSTFLPETLASYCIGKGMDKFIASDISLKDELQDLIQETVVEFSDSDTRNYGNKLPFYHSINILDGLLKFRLMAPEDYDTTELLTALQNEPDIVPPSQTDLDSFYALFMGKIAASENLRKLEIKETYSQEIFAISRKITELFNRIDNLALQYTGDLEIQWKDRVDTYVKTLQDFKPATALTLLERLESSIQTSTKKPGQNFMAFLEFQKGQCLEFLGRRDEAFRAKLKAWSLDSSSIVYGQSAAIHLFRANDANLFAETVAAIFKLDPFNPVAWALDTLQKANQEDLKEVLKNVPAAVSYDPSFRRVLFTEAKDSLQEAVIEAGMVPNCLDYQEKELTIDGFNTAIFWINTAVRTIFRIYYLDYYENSQLHRAEMTVLNRMIVRFLEKTRGSELTDKFERLEFLLTFTEFSLDGNKENALKLETVYRRTADKQVMMTIQTANALQLVNMFDRAIELLEVVPNLTTEALLLLLYCYQKKGEKAGYCVACKRFTASISVFDSKYLLMYINLMVEIKLEGLLDEFSKSDFVSGKTYSQENDEKLVNAVADLIFDNPVNEETCTFLNEVGLTNGDLMLTDIIGSAFFASEFYESALNILSRNLEGKAAGRTLYQYIHANNKTGKDYNELLKLLENWRLNLPFSPQFCRLEMQLRRDLVEWKTVADICEYYLENIPDDSFMLAMFAHSLHLLNDEAYNAKIASLSERAKVVDFKRPEHLIALCDVLFMHGYAEPAFELLYPKALHPAAIELRTAYAKLVLNRGDNLTFFAEYEIAEIGHFIKFERDKQVSYVELTDSSHQHRLHKMFIGLQVGDSVIVNRQLSNITDTFKITRIMNKYLALFDQILNQSSEDPYAGLPFASMKFDTENPGSFFETIQAMFGDKHRIAEQTKDADFDAYYSRNISLTELISKEYNQKFIQGYYNLISFHNGINTIRHQDFANHPDLSTAQLVIDYNTLLLFYQIWQFHKYEFKEKFIISRYIVEAIRSELGNFQYGTDRFDTAGIEVGRTEVNAPAFEFLKDWGAYLQGVLDWVTAYCDVQVSDNTIDAIKKTNINIGEKPMIDAAISTLLLVTDNPNRILVTDDTFCLRMSLLPFNRVISSEHFLKTSAGDNPEILNELVKNRYIGYSPNELQLNEEFSKLIAGAYSNYTLLLSNLNVLNSRANPFTAIGHLKEIALKPMLSNEQILRDMTTVLVNLLLYCNEAFIDLYAKKIYVDFLLFGKKQDIALLAIQNAKQIILSGRN